MVRPDLFPALLLPCNPLPGDPRLARAARSQVASHPLPAWAFGLAAESQAEPKQEPRRKQRQEEDEEGRKQQEGAPPRKAVGAKEKEQKSCVQRAVTSVREHPQAVTAVGVVAFYAALRAGIEVGWAGGLGMVWSVLWRVRAGAGRKTAWSERTAGVGRAGLRCRPIRPCVAPPTPCASATSACARLLASTARLARCNYRKFGRPAHLGHAQCPHSPTPRIHHLPPLLTCAGGLFSLSPALSHSLVTLLWPLGPHCRSSTPRGGASCGSCCATCAPRWTRWAPHTGSTLAACWASTGGGGA